VRCTRKLNTTTNDNNIHIERLNEQVQARQAQVTILQRKNNNLSVAATATKAENDSAVHKLTADAAREDEEKNEKDKKASLYRILLSYGAGRGKWKCISWELFRMSHLRIFLIDEAVDHIRDNVYTASNMAYVTDMHHGLNLMGIDNIRKIQYGKKHTKKRFCSSAEVKRVQRKAERDMQEVISFTIIKERHQDALVDVVRFDMGALFAYLIEVFGLGRDAKHRNVEIAVMVDGARLDKNCQHVTV
jgi:hypothetical protein